MTTFFSIAFAFSLGVMIGALCMMWLGQKYYMKFHVERENRILWQYAFSRCNKELDIWKRKQKVLNTKFSEG